MRDALAASNLVKVEASQLKYLGIEGHWKVFYEEGSLTSFIYLSANPRLVYNCMYEVQFYKSKIGNDLFGPELALEDPESNQLIGFGVKVRRPAINLANLIEVVWSDLADCCQERHSDLKVYFIFYQIASLILKLLLRRNLIHDGLCLQAFYIDRLNWEIKLCSFAFCRSEVANSE